MGPRQIERAANLGDAWFPGPVSDLPGLFGGWRNMNGIYGIEGPIQARELIL
jgi:hypothetical protein